MTRLIGLLLFILLIYYGFRNWSRGMARLALGKLEPEQLERLRALAKDSRALRSALASRDKLHQRLLDRPNDQGTELSHEIDAALGVLAEQSAPPKEAIHELSDAIADLTKAIKKDGDPAAGRARLNAAKGALAPKS